ncbi:hypothetical protein [Mucilaginibacter sp. 3215]|uniref:hypothetical protein n=1 Tax=Mucilaginibacter sp. 3215 TaxID=3373912 RepID=UPI003D230BC9
MEYKRFKDIQHLNHSGRIPYELLLKTKEWRDIREKVLLRDNYTCTNCYKAATVKMNPTDLGYYRKPNPEEIERNRKPITIDWGDGILRKMYHAPIVAVKIENPVILHVHHLYYVLGNLPWQYDLQALVTVCHACHLEIHKTQQIPVYSDDNLTQLLELKFCDRCFGTGFLAQFIYFHEGVCFACGGYKFTAV